MATIKATKNDIDKYIAAFPVATQIYLKKMRETIIKAAPQADEIISYRMPAYKYHGVLAYFAGYSHHIGFYPGASGITNFKADISKYKNAKGSVQFPLDKPLPVRLITKIVKYRSNENLIKFESKSKKKK